MTNEAQALSGAAVGVVAFAGERLEIRPLRFGQLLDILAVASPLIESLTALGNASADDLGFFFELVRKHRQEVPQVLALATGREAAFIESAELDEVLDLFAAVYGANRDFFDQRLRPAIDRLGARLRAGKPGAGSTPPSS
ncbi:hypothetical protein CSC62_07560 [Pseudoxanthomonas jiangsuensis]|uniref:hypothetical protein n=1 Tax=Pseudoxanthomonas jiangsuensis TaxID=619688 RepID=UPI0013911F2D|nr:hypothetical protein [Pseudoxanthomonas jiangsuensis]KAF1697993.1 hypothetical protein CSC62_07560 [Pseudoxanthomonas jiangsuensis]